MASRHRLLLRWSWRDLRRRKGLVVLTAVIIAIGTGTYGGLGGSSSWRIESQDASYAQLGYHDLRVRLPDNVDVEAGALIGQIAPIDGVDAVEERLVVPTQVDASTADDVVLVPGELVGLAPDATIDQLHVASGTAEGWGADQAVLEQKFVDDRGLPDTGTIAIGGGRELRYEGTGVTPEHFRVQGATGAQLTGAYGYAVVYLPLAAAQELSGREGRVDDAVVRLAAEADADAVAAEVEAALADVGATVETRDDDTVRRTLYADARNDEKMWTALSLLILAGAAFAAFNLVTRMVEAERREIGVGMALGTPVARLAVRPLLVGLQIAVLGVALGVVVGLGAGHAMRDLLVDFLPLPTWHTPFPVGRYAQAAVLGIVLPMLATIIPVRRALRVEPVEALRPVVAGTGSGEGSALARRLRRRPRHRGGVVAAMPVRNVVRSPRRTLLTALGIGASITTLVAVLGMLDSIGETFDRSDAEVAQTTPDRLEVTLSGFDAAQGELVAAIAADPTVARAEPGLRLGGTLRPVGDDGTEVETVLDLVDFSDGIWTPTIVEGEAPGAEPSVVLAQKAADDLGVGPGDPVVLEHPVRDGMSYRLVETEVTVAGIHPNPLRFFTYLDAGQADLFGLEGIVDVVTVVPAEGSTADEVQRSLFATEGVASVQEVAVLGDLLRRQLGQITGILRLLEGFALALALLIALNSATLAMEERRREQATMFAFGLPVRTVLRTMVVETFLVAVVGTLIGMGGGYLALSWLLHMFTTDTFPEVGIEAVLHPMSLLAVAVLGVGVATAAPLFAIRRLRRTDIPSTLRVLE